MRQTLLLIVVFITLSLGSFLLSDAPLRVHLVNSFALILAVVVPGLISQKLDAPTRYFAWVIGAVLGLLYWDVFSAQAIVKREPFEGWYIIYPVGFVCIVLLQLSIERVGRDR